MLTVRVAEPGDLAEVTRGARAFARQANIEHLVSDNIEASITTLIGMDEIRIYLAETDEVVGGIGISILPFLWNPALTEMAELFFWVYPGAPVTAALALLRRVMNDAETERVDLATFVKLSTSPEKVGRVYERFGFVRLQETYVREFLWP